jgi:hypothetical protein
LKNKLFKNKTENAISPLPARTKASNADMTACRPLQCCIVQTTRLPPRCSPANKATGRIISRRCSGSFSNCIQALCSHLQWQDTAIHGHRGSTFGLFFDSLDLLKFWAKISYLLRKINIRILFEYSNKSPELYSVANQYFKSFHMVSGSTIGLVGTKYISN